MQDQVLYRLAGISAAIAIVTLVISGIALALFFGGRGTFWGPVNDIFISLTMIALVLPIVAVDRMAGDSVPWLRAVTLITLAGALLVAVGQSLLVAGVLSLEGSYVTGGIGFIAILLWMIVVAYLALGVGVLPAAVGWFAVLALGLVVVEAVVASVAFGPALLLASALLLLALVGWLGALSAGLLSRATA